MVCTIFVEVVGPVADNGVRMEGSTMKGQHETTRKAYRSSQLIISHSHFLQRSGHSLLLQFVKSSQELGNV